MKRVVCCGLGPIGDSLARECIRNPEFELVGLVDPARAGQQIGGLQIEPSLKEIPTNAEVALFSTTSVLATLLLHVSPALHRGMHVVSSCEDLAYPWYADPTSARELDTTARAAHKAVVGAGINPGFAMDLLPALAASSCLHTKGIEVKRSVDLSARRKQLSDKLGVGLLAPDWGRLTQAKAFGHRGLVESAYLCALAVNWAVKSTEFKRTPIVERNVVTGVNEVAVALCDNGYSVRLELEFRLESKDIDVIQLTGDSELRIQIDGIRGDDATVARMLHCAKLADNLTPGLRLPLEVPTWAGDASATAVASVGGLE